MIQNIAQHLTRMAHEAPFQEAVIFPAARQANGQMAYTQLTYQQLDQLSDRLAQRLRAHGIGDGLRTAFLVKPSIEFFVVTFALFKAKAVPVLIDPGIGVKNMKRCLEEARVEGFVGITAAHLARLILRWPSVKHKLLIGKGAGLFGALDYETLLKEEGGSLPDTQADETAAILFTSGSTGAPKGAVYTHANFLSQVELLNAQLRIERGERDLCTFPLFALFAPALGMTAVIPEMDFTQPAKVDPEKIKEAIETFGITNMFGSPALIKRVAAYAGERNWQFSSLKRVISAGAPVQADLIASFRKLLPEDARFYTPYGATESLPVAMAESAILLSEARDRHAAGQGLCVGAPLEPKNVAIIRITDEALPQLTEDDLLPDGEIGEIIVSGAQVTRAYFGRDDATRLGKTLGPDGRFYHRMGDLAYRDAEGQLWFCGRKGHRVQSPQGTLYTIPCEAVFNQHPLVARTALVGLGAAPQQKPLLCVEPVRALSEAEKAQLWADLKTVAKKYSHTQPIDSFLLHPNFPVDIRHNAKIFREKLKTWAEQTWSPS